MTEGCASTVKLGKKGIESLTKKNPELGKAIAEFSEGVSNPTLEIAQKAESNYAVASFRIRNGETILGKGAYSTSKGAEGAIEKMHVEKNNIIHTIYKEGDVISDMATFKPIKTYRDKILELSQKPDYNKYELKKLITEADNEIYANFRTAYKSEDATLISSYIKDLEAEIKYINDNPEYADLLRSFREKKFKPNGSFDGYEHALDIMHGIKHKKPTSMETMVEMLKWNRLYDLV